MDTRKLYAVIIPIKRKEESTIREANEAVLAEWPDSRNGGIKPDNVYASSTRTMWWRCPKGHLYNEVVKERVSGRGCPYCDHWKEIEQQSIEKDPDKLNAWIVQISGECIGSSNGRYITRVSIEKKDRLQRFKCRQGHFFKATMSSRFRGEQCPKCKILQEKK